MVCNVFTDDLLGAITKIEIVAGLGTGLGPFIGSLVYKELQFAGTMYLFGSLNLLTIIICVFSLPNQLNKTVSVDEVAEFEAEMEDIVNYEETISKKTITWWTVF